MKRGRPAPRRRVVVDGRALEAPLPTISELVKLGTAGEVREGLQAIATLLRADRLPEPLRHWLADALDAIGRGDDPNAVFGLKREKKYGIRWARAMDHMIDDLVRQGLSRAEARDVVGRLDLKENVLKNRSDASETVRKRLQRAKR